MIAGFLLPTCCGFRRHLHGRDVVDELAFSFLQVFSKMKTVLPQIIVNPVFKWRRLQRSQNVVNRFEINGLRSHRWRFSHLGFEVMEVSESRSKTVGGWWAMLKYRWHNDGISANNWMVGSPFDAFWMTYHRNIRIPGIPVSLA